MFATAPFTVVKTQKQPKCRLTAGWTSKVWYLRATEWHSAFKGAPSAAMSLDSVTPSVAVRQDAARDYHTKGSKSGKDKYHMVSLLRGI